MQAGDGAVSQCADERDAFVGVQCPAVVAVSLCEAVLVGLRLRLRLYRLRLKLRLRLRLRRRLRLAEAEAEA